MLEQCSVVCSDCDEPIVDNEEYVLANGNYYHLCCLEIMTTHDLIETLGHEIKIFKEEEYGEC